MYVFAFCFRLFLTCFFFCSSSSLHCIAFCCQLPARMFHRSAFTWLHRTSSAPLSLPRSPEAMRLPISTLLLALVLRLIGADPSAGLKEELPEVAGKETEADKADVSKDGETEDPWICECFFLFCLVSLLCLS